MEALFCEDLIDGLPSDASTQSPCTSTMFLMGSALTVVDETRASATAAARNAFMSTPQALM
jgi:hypothetical protein